jgi:hypothetical protein
VKKLGPLYDKMKGDVRFRKEVGRKSGFGFRASKRVFVQNPRYWTEWTETRKIPA